jgi:polysaccharide export outer membrane protein
MIACIRRAPLAAALTVLLAAPAWAQRPDSGAVLAGPQSDARASDVLRPGDVLRLRIWLEPDMSGEYEVDENGMAVLPRLGVVKVSGVPVADLKRQLVARYREFLQNPSIEIVPLRRVAIVGAVQNPGIYRVEPSVTVGEAVSIAGGRTRDGKRDVIELSRAGRRVEIDLQQRLDLAGMPLASGDQIYLPERSWLSQNATWFVSTLVGAAGTMAIIFVR